MCFSENLTSAAIEVSEFDGISYTPKALDRSPWGTDTA
jgi:hypothetical protein